VVADTTLFAEGLDADPAGHRVFLASIRHRTLYEVNAAGQVRDLEVSRDSGVGAIFAVRFDSARGVLWAATSGLPLAEGYREADSALAALLKIDPATGAILARYPAPPSEPHVLGDIALTPAGDVLVSDSRSPVIFRLRSGADSLEGFRHPLFRSLQGIAPSPDGQTIYLADYSHGLFRWRPEAGTLTRLTAPPGVTTLGLDGILLVGNSIVGVQNGVYPPRVIRYTLGRDDRLTRADVIDRHWPLADEPTNLTRMGDQLLYLATSQWEKYNDDGSRKAGTHLGPTVVLALKLSGE
jgi:hypothetical protein